jgi:hypothetical protein
MSKTNSDVSINLDIKPIKFELLNKLSESINKKFPNSNLNIAFKKEKIKNKLRLFYFKNVLFLNKIFDPIINILISVFGKIPLLLKTNSSITKNLMNDKTNSII